MQGTESGLPIHVIVVEASQDIAAKGLALSIDERQDMTLVGGGCVSVPELEALLQELPAAVPVALVLVGRPGETDRLAERWLQERADLVVLHVGLVGNIVRISVRDPRLDALLAILRGLVERVGASGARVEERVAHVELESGNVAKQDVVSPDQLPSRPLFDASVAWVHALLADAIDRVPEGHGDVHGLSVTKATLVESLRTAPEQPAGEDLARASTRLSELFAAADASSEPLAAVARGFELTLLEFQMLVLALAPELDLRFQRCVGFLLDEMPRRVGTVGLYCTLLGATARTRSELAAGGAFAAWPVFDGFAGHQTPADEPLKLDPVLAQWILGDADALNWDARTRRLLRPGPWPGADLLQRNQEAIKAADLLKEPQGPATPWVVLSGDDPAGWRALIELGARTPRRHHHPRHHHYSRAPIRVDVSYLAGLPLVEVEDCARRLARLAQLSNRPLAIDMTRTDGSDAEAEGLRAFFGTLDAKCRRAFLIIADEARLLPLLRLDSFEIAERPPLPAAARIAAVQAAAAGAGVYVTEESAAAISSRFPLQIDGLEYAMALARSRHGTHNAHDQALGPFTAACRQIATEGLSRLAESIEPLFNLDDVVLPLDQHQQLVEIIDNVRHAPRVYEEWKFRERLPYGRGITALFFGASGTGKTMAAIGIARQLGIQLLRVDLSRVVSKYIGDTEKNIDKVFTDAERSGSAILIDEADALFGKRSEVKDAHDRYANIEVAYLLQRMESYHGLAILTTNMRQNLDPAFLRRLRFIIDFPRPDAEAREKIWRQCLPVESHVLDDAAFRQLARKIDLTGGHIRQITLRAAFMAAAAGAQIGLAHIAHAARAEFAKLGMPPVELDLSQARQAA